MLKDLRHALRLLLRAKGWTTVVVASLALGIGANAALFSAVNGLLLKKLAVKDPDTLVRLRHASTRNDMVTNSSDYGTSAPSADGLQVRATFSYPMFQRFVADNQTMSDVFASAPYGRVNVVFDRQAELATAFISSGNYYRVLGVEARLGRTILPDDDRTAAEPVAVISDRYWRTRFARDPAAVGKVIRINNVQVTLVGVLPPDFVGVQRPVGDPPDVSLPLALDAQVGSDLQRLRQPTNWWLQVMGRLKPEATAAQVEGNLGSIFQEAARAGLASYLAGLTPEQRSLSRNQNRTEAPRLRVDAGSRGVYDVRTQDVRTVTVLGGVVVLVLLIVCANVANLLLSRATAREKELSIRLSLGASRARLVRQHHTESLLLAAIGGAAGVLVGYWGHLLLPAAAGQGVFLDWRVLSFILALTTTTGIVFGIAPALRASGSVGAALKENSRSVAAGRTILGKLLLVVQVAISVVLLIGAGLFVRTVQNLRRVDVGFNPRNLAIFRVNPQLNRYEDKQMTALYENLLDRLPSVPGVRAAALSHVPLLSGGVNSTSIFIQGRTYGPDDRHDIYRLVVSTNFFETMEMPLVAGRGFTADDHQTAPKVAVINETAARRYLGNENPVGRRFGTSLESSGEVEIVGVLRDAKYDSVRDDTPPTMYLPFRQNRMPTAIFELRTAADPATVIGAVRQVVREIDSNLPLTDVSTQVEQIDQRFLQERFFAQAYSLFGALALLLAAIGLFGVMSYSVARRTNEIGIRMALGAQRLDVLRMVLSESMMLVVLGLLIGLAGAAAAGRLLASQLFGLTATDVTTQLAATLVMLLVSALAGYLPARRASRVDPMVALRWE